MHICDAHQPGFMGQVFVPLTSYSSEHICYRCPDCDWFHWIMPTDRAWRENPAFFIRVQHE
jgi:hypothetical protein